jgi:hypothetical protein
MPRPPPLQNTEELSKYFRIVVHVMQRVVTQQMAKDTGFEGHGMAIAVREAQQTLINTAIRLRPVLQACTQIAVDVERHNLKPHSGAEL